MINVTPKPITGEKNCKTCGCPLYLLKLERRRWEARNLCVRCVSPDEEPVTKRRKQKERDSGEAGVDTA